MNKELVSLKEHKKKHTSQKDEAVTHLWISSQLGHILLGVKLSELARPRPHSSDVQAQGLFMRRWRQRERMVLICTQHQACDANPLARTIHKALWSLELQMCHTYRYEIHRRVKSDAVITWFQLWESGETEIKHFSRAVTWRQQLSSKHRDLRLLPAQADEFVEQEEQRRWDKVDVETRLLDEGVAAMNNCLLNVNKAHITEVRNLWLQWGNKRQRRTY